MATHADETTIQNRQEADSAKVKRKRRLLVLTLLFAFAAVAAVSAFFLWWQHEEETEDAYVAGRVVQITPQTGGVVRKVLHDDTDVVKKGDVLAVLDDGNYVLAYERAKNELIQAVRQNRQQNAATSQAGAQVALRRADLARAQDDLRRRFALAESGAVSAEELAHARAAVSQAQAAVKAALAEESSARAALGGQVALREQPAVQTAVSRLKDAWLNLQRWQSVRYRSGSRWRPVRR